MNDTIMERGLQRAPRAWEYCHGGWLNEGPAVFQPFAARCRQMGFVEFGFNVVMLFRLEKFGWVCWLFEYHGMGMLAI